MHTVDFQLGGYRFAPGVFQYSAGVVAMEGHHIRRVRFRRPIPMREGFQRIEALLTALERPRTAFCACEMRSPGQFSEDGFRRFNETYVETLARWGLYDGATNPVARSNVCPEIGAPAEPSFHAFCFTVKTDPSETTDVAPSFVVAGSGEAPEGKNNYRDHIVRLGDIGAEGLREKARFVLAEMERRLGLLGASWRDVTATQVYTVHDFHPFLRDEIVTRGAAPDGLTWHFDRPPVVDLEFEMDCRGVADERVL
ncbi:MAG: hypothetical protein HQ481_16490 [Alphaproteobacteria bacterium]|nr:hypothetical protein [Alphaproteobacteria bacterium]